MILLSKTQITGPNTINYSWSAWGDFGACSVECGADGIQERFRTCNPPSNGGYPCPSQQQSDSQTCNNGPCPGLVNDKEIFEKLLIKMILPGVIR